MKLIVAASRKSKNLCGFGFLSVKVVIFFHFFFYSFFQIFFFIFAVKIFDLGGAKVAFL